MEEVLGDIEAASQEDIEFHRLLAVCTNNELYPVLLDVLRPPLLNIRRETFVYPGRSRLALQSHHEILECIEAGMTEAARERMREHLEDVLQLWQQLKLLRA